MKSNFKRIVTLLFAMIMVASACLLASCGGDKDDGTPAQNSDQPAKSYTISVATPMDLGPVSAKKVGAKDGGTAYAFTVKPKVGYEVKSFQINGQEVALEDNKVECVLKADASVSVFYQRKNSEELQKRRQTVVDKMKVYTSTFFKYDKTYTYILHDKTITLEAGKLHAGLPYTMYAATSPDAFIDFAIRQDPDGAYVIAPPSGTNPFYWGGSCGNAAFFAWASVSSTIRFTYSADMLEKNGAIPVGVWSFDPATDIYNNVKFNDTKKICENNGINTMYEAYTYLMPGDAITYISPEGNHVVIVSDIRVARRNDGTIDPSKSQITYMDQHGGWNNSSFSGGKNAYTSCNYNGTMNFFDMYDTGYLPVSCIELLDDSQPLAKAEVIDSIKGDTLSLINVTRGYVEANYAISKVVMEIFDANGAVVYKGTRYTNESAPQRVGFSTFTTPDAELMKGVYTDVLNMDALASGTYRQVVTAYLTNGENYVARDKNFTK